MRTARELDASAKRKKQGGGVRGAKKIFFSIFLSLASLASRPPPPSPRTLVSFALFLVFMLRHKILKSKFNRLAKLSMPPGVR